MLHRPSIEDQRSETRQQRPARARRRRNASKSEGSCTRNRAQQSNRLPSPPPTRRRETAQTRRWQVDALVGCTLGCVAPCPSGNGCSCNQTSEQLSCASCAQPQPRDIQQQQRKRVQCTGENDRTLAPVEALAIRILADKSLDFIEPSASSSIACTRTAGGPKRARSGSACRGGVGVSTLSAHALCTQRTERGRAREAKHEVLKALQAGSRERLERSVHVRGVWRGKCS